MRIALPILAALLCAAAGSSQPVQVRIYSEFDRLNTRGERFESVPGREAIEILSPAAVRNGFVSFHVAVTARPGILYWFAVQSSAPDAFRVRVYKEHAAPDSLVHDDLREEPKPLYFLGVMPDRAGPAATDVYLLDIWTPLETAPGTYRLEVMVKEAYWVVAPMEIRVLPAAVPKTSSQFCPVSLPPKERPLEDLAAEPLLAAMSGNPLPCSIPPRTVREVIRRNAMQDASFVLSLPPERRQAIADRLLSQLLSQAGFLNFSVAADWYPPIRRMIQNTASRFPLPSNTGKQ